MAAAEETKKQFIDAVRQGTHILVTVKTNPSIDQLASCIALTVLLNSLGKRATAVFSGKVPPSIDFLKPGKMLQSNTDSLQDFIISLDKNKADKLRYKVEENMVKVYITPYQTSLSGSDLVYSKGDFNVDTVIALGTHSQSELDQAVTSHGRILHDANVIAMNTDENAGDLGSVNWIDTQVSSLSEMIAQAVSELAAEKPEALDQQVATALLAGIVAETESFGNGKTTPTTMEVAGRLLAAGANQELVATRLSGPLKSSPSDDGRDVSNGRKHKGAPGNNGGNQSSQSQGDNSNSKTNKGNRPDRDAKRGDKGNNVNQNNQPAKDSASDSADALAKDVTALLSEPPIVDWAKPEAGVESAPAAKPEVGADTAPADAGIALPPEVKPLRDQSSATTEPPKYQPVIADPSLTTAPANLLSEEPLTDSTNPIISDLGIVQPLDGEGDDNGQAPPAGPPAIR